MSKISVYQINIFLYTDDFDDNLFIKNRATKSAKEITNMMT